MNQNVRFYMGQPCISVYQSDIALNVFTSYIGITGPHCPPPNEKSCVHSCLYMYLYSICWGSTREILYKEHILSDIWYLKIPEICKGDVEFKLNLAVQVSCWTVDGLCCYHVIIFITSFSHLIIMFGLINVQYEAGKNFKKNTFYPI